MKLYLTVEDQEHLDAALRDYEQANPSHNLVSHLKMLKGLKSTEPDLLPRFNLEFLTEDMLTTFEGRSTDEIRIMTKNHGI